MPRSLVVAFALTALTPLAAPQAPTQFQEFARLSKDAVDAVGAKKYDDAAAALKRCLELLPGESTTLYNVACVHSLKGELDAAFEALGKALDAGFGFLIEDDWKLFETKDEDLAACRKDARFAALVERARARRKELADLAAAPSIYVPEKLKDEKSLPLLVVLPDAGQTAANTLEHGPWKRVADDLGVALMIPSGRLPAGADAKAGTCWFDFCFKYADKPWIYEKPVGAAFDLFAKSHPIDRSRVFIAGEGQGGMVAFNVAVSAPGTWKGVVALRSTLLRTNAMAARGRMAGRAGLKARLLVPAAGVYAPQLEAGALDQELTATGRQLTEWGIPDAIEHLEIKADDADGLAARLEAALKGFQPAAPAEEKKEGEGEKDDDDGGGGGGAPGAAPITPSRSPARAPAPR
jgi:tetratricopeptide (TPR) repeat protein